MNNIIQLNKPSTQPAVPDHSDAASIYFPVALRDVHVNGRTVDGYRAVVREDTGEVLGIHGDGYKLVPNRQVFPAFEDALSCSELNLSGMTVSDAVSHGGAKTARTYRFPEHRCLIDDQDSVDLQLRVVNSYDGSMAFSCLVGGFRLLCSNGMVIGQSFAQSYGRHTRGLDISGMIIKMENALLLYLDQSSQWRRWAGREIGHDDASRVFSKIPGMNERLHKKLMAYWHKERQMLGPTLWALYNAATYWSTHEAVRRSSSGNRQAIVLQREQRVRSMINGPAFSKLAA
jgi:Domain of unknown function (DUF932)